MTNEMIIFMESQKLAEAGVISYTGREYKAQDMDGNEIIVKETEPIHTFAAWKQKGYSVRKGQKAIAQFTIWKHTGPRTEEVRTQDGESVEVADRGRMFMKQAIFFKFSQVDPIKAV